MRSWNLKTNWPGVLLLVCALGVFFWAASRGWNYPPTDSHAARQAQTAITAQMLYENGLSPLTPFNGLGPPWNVPMEFPTYQIVTALLTNLTGGDIISAGRIASLIGSLLLIPPLWLLLGRLNLSANERLFTVALLFSCPLWVHFSRSVLIETWAIALALWWLAALVEVLSRPTLSCSWLISAAALGVLSALTKVTSFAVVLPVGALITASLFRSLKLKGLVRPAIATGPGILAALAWTHLTDGLKQMHPYADFLTSEKLSAWNWGTLAQRLDGAWWQRWTEHLGLIVPVGLFILLVFGLIKGNTKIRIGIGLATLTSVTGPLAFANLYYVHNYYFIAVAPAVIVAVGLGLATLWRLAESRRWQQILIVFGILGFGYIQTQSYLVGFGEGQVRNRPLPELAHLLKSISTPDDNIAVIGREWDPLLTYATDRAMVFVRETHETDEDAWQLSRAALDGEDYTILIAMDSVAGDLAFVHHRCRELGLAITPLFTTADADVYVSQAKLEEFAAWSVEQQAGGLVLPQRPFRMEPGESRIEFITADWRPVKFSEANGMLDQCQPYPDMIFTRHATAQLQAEGKDVLHIHPPGGLRFNSLTVDRTIVLEYGLRPDIWENQHDSDGVRFRLFTRGPNDRQRLAWTDWVRPLSIPADQTMLHTKLNLPANHELELWIDAGPDHNPGYDWSIIGKMTVR